MIKFNYGDSMNKKKIIMIIIVTILVISLSLLFIKLFDFEDQTSNNDEHNISKKIDEETIHQLYSYFLENNEVEYSGIHSTHYVGKTIVNQNPQYVNAMVYQYILNNDKSSLEVLTKEELNRVVNNSLNYTPLYKVSLSKFEEVTNLLLGPEVTLKPREFSYTNKVKAVFVDNYYYIYDTLEETTKDFVEFKSITRYAVSEDAIKIYEYYLKCDTTTNLCYNDEARDSLSNITYTNDFSINDYLNNLTIYEHTFKYNSNTDTYYWNSSQMD